MRLRARWRLRALLVVVAVSAGIAFVVREGPYWWSGFRSWRANRPIYAQLERPIALRFPQGAPLRQVLKSLRVATQSSALPDGIPIYVEPTGLQAAGQTVLSPIQLDGQGLPLRTSLRAALNQIGLNYAVKDGLMTITAQGSEDK